MYNILLYYELRYSMANIAYVRLSCSIGTKQF